MGCIRSSPLQQAADIRLAQLETCDCINHSGFSSIQPYFNSYTNGEVLAAAPYHLSQDQAMELWYNSPEHKEIVFDSGMNEYGFATSSSASPTGWYYAVMEVDRK